MTQTINRGEIHPVPGKQPYWRISEDGTGVVPDQFQFCAYAVTMAPSGWQSAPNAGSDAFYDVSHPAAPTNRASWTSSFARPYPYICRLTIPTTEFEAVKNQRQNRDIP